MNVDELSKSELLLLVKKQNQIIKSFQSNKKSIKSEFSQNKVFELLINISNTYINIPIDQFEKIIDSSLAELGNFANADRLYIFDYDFEKLTASNTHEWCSEGIEPQIENLQETPVGDMHDWTDSHRNGNYMYVYDVLTLDEDSSLRNVLEPQGIKSILTVPLMDNKNCIGFIGFDWVKELHTFSKNEKKLLEVFAEILVNFKKRRDDRNNQSKLIHSLSQLNENLEKLVEERTAEIIKISKIQQAIYENAPLTIISTDASGLLKSINQAGVKLLGYNPEELIDKINPVIFHDLEELRKIFRKENNTGNNPDDEELYHYSFDYITNKNSDWNWLKKNGEKIRISLCHSTLKDNNGHVIGYVIVITNITERHFAELKHQQTLDQLTSLINNLHIGTLFENADRKISLTNQYFCKLFSSPFTPEQMIGYDCVEAAQTTKLLMKDPEGFIDNIDKIIALKKTGLNQILELKDGRFLEYDYIPIFHDKILTGHLWTYRNITNKMIAQNSIRLQKDHANSLSAFSNLHSALKKSIKTFIKLEDVDCGGIYLFNPLTKIPELVAHENLSEKFVKIATKYTPTSQQIKIANSGKSIFGKYEDIIKSKHNLEEKDNILGLAVIPIKHKKEIIGLINLGSRYTDNINKYTIVTAELMALQLGNTIKRIMLNDAVINSQKNFKKLFDTIDDFMFILDENGNIMETNQAVIDKLGYSCEELKSLHILTLHSPERREEAGTIVKNMIEGRELYCPVPLYCKNGQHIPVETRVVMGEWDQKSVLFGISRDITESIKVMKSLEQTIQKEKELNDLKSRFVSMASHEFRTPLASILMSAETLSSYWKKMSEQQTDAKLDNIKYQVFHLDSIVSNVMMVSKIQEGKIKLIPKEIDLYKMCLDIINNFIAIEDKNAEITFESEFSSLIMSLDERLMIQVLTNLISNAIKYSQPNPLINIQLRLDKKFVIFTIRDNGIGIPAVDHEKMFQPFYRATNVKSIEGNGLGLNIVKQSLILHGGDICFKSELNKGAEFYIYLPKTLITHFENNTHQLTKKQYSWMKNA